MSINHTTEIIQLSEYESVLLPCEKLTEAAGEILWRDYNNQINVEFPSPRTKGQWQLTAQGWVGYIPLSSEFALALHPRVPLRNLFGMLEYAHRLKSFHFLNGLMECQSLQEFYERLANVLARRVLDRGRKGLYRTYVENIEHLPCVRGRLDLRQIVRKPWEVKLKCRYEEHTSNIEDNQILVWTLWCITRSGVCTERVLPTLRLAYRGLQGFVTLQRVSPQACVGRLYNRLNDDYLPLHSLCRFFLEQSGPSHESGRYVMLPFLVNMARLYELFIAEWLKLHLPQDIVLKSQERVNIDEEGRFHFNIDLVLYEVRTGYARCVIDTKYRPSGSTPEDLAQVVAYATAKSCREAILVYPALLSQSINVTIGDIHVRSLTFQLDGDLERAGQVFVQELLASGF